MNSTLNTINTNVQSIFNHGVYNRNTTAMNEAMSRVATGQKINSAKDNASLWAITQRMRDRIRANDQANQNVQNDSALLRTAQGGIDNTVSILTTLKERAINAANDSNLNLDREAIAVEVKQLVQQIDDNATKVKFNGRYLLNGAADTTGTQETEDAAAAQKNPNIIEPDAAGMPAYQKDGTTTGSHAVYKLDSLLKWNSSAITAANTDLLTDLVKTGANAATDTIFKVGDKITFSWKEDGVDNSYTYEVTSTSKVSSLAFDVGAIHFYNESTSTATNLESKSQGKYKVEADNGTETEYNKNAVWNNAATRVQKQSTASKTGDLYAVGDYGVKITDFKVAVNYLGADGNDATRKDAQAAFKMTGVQQAADYDPTTQGTATVFKQSYATGSYDGDTTLKELGIVSGALDDDLITFKWGDGENDSITVQANTSLSALQTALEEQGKSLNLTIVQGNSTSQAKYDIKDADGNFVQYAGDNFGSASKVEGTNFQVTQSATAANTDLYFASKTGVRLDKDDFKITATSADGQDARTVTQFTLTNQIKYREEAAAEETKDEPIVIGPSTALSFHIGGEADFNINVTIDKMTVENLFAERDADGNVTKVYDDTTFSDLFKTKDGAKEALSIIDNALNKALNEQTKIGAVESRLGYTSDNITTMNENLEAANSAFRDSDIAKEMTNYMKYAVLSQAAQYMLAQSNQNAFQTLNLLQQ